MTTKHLVLFGMAVSVTCGAVPAAAERASDRGWLKGGAFFANVDSTLRIDDQNLGLTGTIVDFEKDLGLDDKETLPKIDGGIRIGKQFRAEVDYIKLKRQASTSLDRILGIDDSNFPVGSDVETELKTDIVRIAGGWSPLRTETSEAGISLGIHLARFEFDIAGAIAPSAGNVISRQEVRKKTVPLPNFGIFANHAFNKTFGIEGRADYFSLKVGDYKGRLVDLQVAATARLLKNLGIGAGYRFTDYEVRVEKTDFRGRFEYQYKGPIIFAELAF